jgi:hypothetical protein
LNVRISAADTMLSLMPSAISGPLIATCSMRPRPNVPASSPASTAVPVAHKQAASLLAGTRRISPPHA